MSSSQKWVFLGKILREFGIRGQLRVMPYNPESEIFAKLKEIYLEAGSEFRPIPIREAKRHGRFWIMQFEGYDHPETAKDLRHIQLALPREKIPKPKKGELYLFDLEGAEVQDPSGRKVGVLRKFIQVGETEVMVIDREEGKEVMVPYRSEFVQSTSVENAIVVLNETAEALLQ